MNRQPVEIRKGIVLFRGKISRNLALDPMVSNSYFLEDGEEVILFDPSCGKEIARRIEDHIRSRRVAQVQWQRAFIIAGHSHADHAGNFYVSDVIGALESHIYIHERGFQDGSVKNQPVPHMEAFIDECGKYYNPYLTYPFPYNLMMVPFAALNTLSPALARNLCARAAALPMPSPINGSLKPDRSMRTMSSALTLGIWRCADGAWEARLSYLRQGTVPAPYRYSGRSKKRCSSATPIGLGIPSLPPLR